MSLGFGAQAGLAALSFGLDQASSAVSYSRQKKLLKRQQDFYERMRATQYQTATEDLEKAGLNRILALGSPAPSASPSAPGVAEGTSGSRAAGASAAVMASKVSAKQIKKLELEIEQTKEDLRLQRKLGGYRPAPLNPNLPVGAAAELGTRIKSHSTSSKDFAEGLASGVEDKIRKVLEFGRGAVNSAKEWQKRNSKKYGGRGNR
jgi:hypothetical protein